MIDVYWITGTCCAGKDHYIKNRWKVGEGVSIVNVGFRLKSYFPGGLSEKVVMNSNRPSSPPVMDAFAYKIARDSVYIGCKLGLDVVVINGFPRHWMQLTEVLSLGMEFKLNSHLVFIDDKKNVRMTRAHMDDSAKSDMRVKRIDSGEMEVYDMWGRVEEFTDRFASVTQIFGGEDVTREPHIAGRSK